MSIQVLINFDHKRIYTSLVKCYQSPVAKLFRVHHWHYAHIQPIYTNLPKTGLSLQSFCFASTRLILNLVFEVGRTWGEGGLTINWGRGGKGCKTGDSDSKHGQTVNHRRFEKNVNVKSCYIPWDVLQGKSILLPRYNELYSEL